LAETINKKIQDIVQDESLRDIQGIIVFEGPGSFTGLRISMSVANALAYSLGVPIVASSGDNWITEGLAQLQSGGNHRIAVPEYGAHANITTPRK
jgi:tRNA threonylcarbamoyladenosine biosynthesis protein TsaB